MEFIEDKEAKVGLDPNANEIKNAAIDKNVLKEMQETMHKLVAGVAALHQKTGIIMAVETPKNKELTAKLADAEEKLTLVEEQFILDAEEKQRLEIQLKEMTVKLDAMQIQVDRFQEFMQAGPGNSTYNSIPVDKSSPVKKRSRWGAEKRELQFGFTIDGSVALLEPLEQNRASTYWARMISASYEPKMVDVAIWFLIRRIRAHIEARGSAGEFPSRLILDYLVERGPLDFPEEDEVAIDVENTVLLLEKLFKRGLKVKRQYTPSLVRQYLYDIDNPEKEKEKKISHGRRKATVSSKRSSQGRSRGSVPTTVPPEVLDDDHIKYMVSNIKRRENNEPLCINSRLEERTSLFEGSTCSTVEGAPDYTIVKHETADEDRMDAFHLRDEWSHNEDGLAMEKLVIDESM